ncbi:TetR family transcriptional regulator [Paenibacillus helianthi]|uniref:TetR family transcriptional regulator n=1 Tax=Paenibacillus helianthi TaxID=1349432 RepID=A0ABX3EXI6_9BACL|nr:MULTISPECIES: TetR/AcrR family transcriptional regulator [Paenibacillus]OKP86164.1 TetR family transcriptional regulator [Paenibacillus sp. P3E]OKP92091.1 TetR family transcriptional regulator [Paenibacillus helianthi]OKP94198.1 TetR family transcriptional regulator [Paenibacillus sp. P32E]
MQIALEKFARLGYHQTKISDIVQEAGVAQGTFYWHFKSKEAIALEIIETGKEQLLQVIAQGYRQDPGDITDMVEASEALFHRLFNFAAENRHLMEILLMGNGADQTIRKRISATRNAMEQAFRRNIERAIELQMLPEGIEVELRAALLMSMCDGLLSRWLFGSEDIHSKVAEASAQQLASELANFEFYGLLGKL